MNQKDAELDTQTESTYECFDCGTVVRAAAPDACPECGAEMRNRRTPIE
ncbi:rubrerythrin-like domain-containing protein [Natrinema amylolyticum]|nr:rubrerythrin-like domain-containing protein [Natrinema amylolyticum]